MTRTIRVNHLPRVEGHGGITVVLEGDPPRVGRVEVNIFEGIRLFEELVRGRRADEVPGIVSRICAICSHGHTVTSLMALEAALGVEVTPQTRRLRDLVYQGANIESHALHFFLLAMPDFLGHASAITVAAVRPDVVKAALRMKKLGNTIQEILGGRAVHPVTYVLGGFSRLPGTGDLLRLRAALEEGVSDCRALVSILKEVDIPSFAREPIRCAALVPDGNTLFFGHTIQLSDGRTIPVADYRAFTNEHPVPHSHAKHSAQDGRSYMVGALARLTLSGDRIRGLARQAWDLLGPTVPCDNILMNNLAQVVELVYSVEHAHALVERCLEEGLERETAASVRHRAGRGAAATEVPRGILFHAYEIDAEGRVLAADVITPTAQNLSHMEDQIRATVRDAIGAPDDLIKHRLEMVVRAYDPCISCSVHLMRAR
jgi:sulfhydrogenase subunit alpha